MKKLQNCPHCLVSTLEDYIVKLYANEPLATLRKVQQVAKEVETILENCILFKSVIFNNPLFYFVCIYR